MLTFHMKSRTHQTYFFFFFFNDTATTEIYTLSLHDALPISSKWPSRSVKTLRKIPATCDFSFTATWLAGRFPFFKSTVPEIVPPVCSAEGGCACAIAVGAQTIKLMLRNRMGSNAAFRDQFLKSCNLHSISTCCALLR